MGSIATGWRTTRSRVTTIARENGRNPDDILLLAVSKTFALPALQAAWDAGARHFGENYVQEAMAKIAAWDRPDTVWHFIGPLQSNKTRDVARHFDWVHTLEREKIARRLSDQRPQGTAPINVCIQINISADPAKAGVSPGAAAELAATIKALPNLRLRGLMAIPAQALSQAELVKQYKAMARLMAQLQARYPNLDTLSIGMSGDMATALGCGSTCVRIGSAIFGPRRQPAASN